MTKHPSTPPRPVTVRDGRRLFIQRLCVGSLAGAILPGCVPQSTTTGLPDLVWGRMGISEGRFQKARAVAISPEDELYIVDKMGRIQVFDLNGNYLRGWNTPAIAQGKPTGLGWSNDGLLMVADTHYFRILFYSPQGELKTSRTIGGQMGDAPGEFHFVTDVAQDQRGHYLVGQYGQIDRIQEFDSQGQFIRTWGSQGSHPGQFSRPQGLMVDTQGLLWVADACNHRIQVFDLMSRGPELVRMWGVPGKEPGRLHTPYGIVLDSDGSVLVCEYGNHRIQRFTADGEPMGLWGGYGKEAGQLLHPWGIVLDSRRRLHVLDTENFRVQRFIL
jgi:sugar lactone lactonase YvrE